LRKIKVNPSNISEKTSLRLIFIQAESRAKSDSVSALEKGPYPGEKAVKAIYRKNLYTAPTYISEVLFRRNSS
jgi:hypothetical protein